MRSSVEQVDPGVLYVDCLLKLVFFVFSFVFLVDPLVLWRRGDLVRFNYKNGTQKMW